MTYEITVRPIDQWPEGWRDPDRERQANPFRVSSYDETLALLRHELDKLGTTAAHLQLDVREGQLRRDGMLRADARVDHPGVILTAETETRGTLVLGCDRFEDHGWRARPLPGWRINLRAIALSLESLRRVDRYGVLGGRQYAGLRAIPATTGTALGPGQLATMSPEAAAEFLAGWSSYTAEEILVNAMTTRRAAIGYVMRRLHPDTGDAHTPDRWSSFLSARAALEGTS